MVRLTNRPDMTLDVYRGRKTTTQKQQPNYCAPGLPYNVNIKMNNNTIKYNYTNLRKK